MLADYLHTALKEQLEKDYRIVQTPGPGVIRVRVAITEAAGSKIALDLMSNVIPIGIGVTAVNRLATGTHSAVGQAGIEGEVLDSVSGERLLAAVDRRAGRKVLRGKFGTWNDVKEAHDYWAEKLRKRLGELRAK